MRGRKEFDAKLSMMGYNPDDFMNLQDVVEELKCFGNSTPAKVYWMIGAKWFDFVRLEVFKSKVSVSKALYAFRRDEIEKIKKGHHVNSYRIEECIKNVRGRRMEKVWRGQEGATPKEQEEESFAEVN